MRFVSLNPVIDPAPYLAVLADLRSELPRGAYEFASDPCHYDFYSSRCVKDLTVDSLTFLDAGASTLEVRLAPNEWKHELPLRIRYEQVAAVSVVVADDQPVGPKRLGAVILDELLPDSAGVLHEIAFHGGRVVVTCRDLRAVWGVVDDPAAQALAQRLGGRPSVWFAGDALGREFDVVSDLYVAQSEPANLQLGLAFREQAKAIFETALETNRTPYFHFEGPPQAGVIEKLEEYGVRYGIDPVIDVSPLG